MKSKFFLLYFVLLLLLGNSNLYAKNFESKKETSSKSFQKEEVANSNDSNEIPLLIVLIDIDLEEDLQDESEKNNFKNKICFGNFGIKTNFHLLQKTNSFFFKRKTNSFQIVFSQFSKPLYLTLQTFRI